MFTIKNGDIKFNTAQEVINWLADNCEVDEDTYNEMLDECYPVYTIGYMTYYASTILKECDPITYNIGLGEELDHLLGNCKYELECLNDGDEYEFMAYTIAYTEEEE